jgi:hypothetical protein
MAVYPRACHSPGESKYSIWNTRLRRVSRTLALLLFAATTTAHAVDYAKNFVCEAPAPGGDEDGGFLSDYHDALTKCQEELYALPEDSEIFTSCEVDLLPVGHTNARLVKSVIPPAQFAAQ